MVKKKAKKNAIKKKVAKKTTKKTTKKVVKKVAKTEALQSFQETKTQEWLPFDLTDQEKITVGQELSSLKENLDKAQQELKQISNRFKNNIKLYETEINSRFAILRDGFESRKVDCTKRVDFTKKIVEFFYESKLISIRPLEEADKQLEIPTKDSIKPIDHKISVDHANPYSVENTIAQVKKVYADDEGLPTEGIEQAFNIPENKDSENKSDYIGSL